jgi:hypothetical protein
MRKTTQSLGSLIANDIKRASRKYYPPEDEDLLCAGRASSPRAAILL